MVENRMMFGLMSSMLMLMHQCYLDLKYHKLVRLGQIELVIFVAVTENDLINLYLQEFQKLSWILMEPI
jgi:hypothetical protein